LHGLAGLITNFQPACYPPWAEALRAGPPATAPARHRYAQALAGGSRALRAGELSMF